MVRRTASILWSAGEKFVSDDGWAIASYIGLTLLMSLFPFLIFVGALAGFFGSAELAKEAAKLVFAEWPDVVARPIAQEVSNVLTAPRSGLLTLGGVLSFYFASSAIEAGFDGVEIHGAHGYLLDAFLRDGANHRTDAYGGSIENRSRLLVEVTRACAAAIGADRLGVRLSPVSTAGDSFDSNPQPLFEHVVRQLNLIGLAYIHVVEGDTGGARDNLPFDYAALRACFDGIWMVNNGYDRAMAIDAIASGRADLVSFGRAFIANPDLVERLRDNSALNPMMDAATVYGGGAHGYIDYPTLQQTSALAAALETVSG